MYDRLFSQVAVPFFILFFLLARIWHHQFFPSRHSNGYVLVVVSHCGFDFRFLMTNHTVSSFAHLLFSIFFEKYIFAHFLLGWPSSYGWILRVLYSGSMSFMSYAIWKYFLPIYDLSFHSLNIVFCRADIFKF